MSLSETNFILSNVNAWLGSAANALKEKNDGADWGTSIMNFGRHALNGTVRNIVAKDIYECTGGDRFGGSYLGYMTNALAGYGTDEADKNGTMGLLGASMLTSAFNPFGGCWGGGWYGGGFCGPSVFGGGFCGGPVMPMTPMVGFPMSYTEINITTNGRGFRHFRC